MKYLYVNNNNMILTENNLRRIIKEEIERQILTENKVIIDNFDDWGDLLNCTDPDQFYFVQILKRYKDNPNIDKTQNYHAGASYGIYDEQTAFKVRNKEDLMKIKPMVVKYCDENNARAYISSNPRSEKAISNFIPSYRKRFNPNDARYKHAEEILAGQSKYDPVNFPERKRFMLDIDTKDKSVWRLTKIIIKHYGIPIIKEFNTPSGGLHIMLPDAYAQEIPRLIRDLRVFDASDHHGQRNFFPDKGKLQTVHANFDGKFILYSNVETKGY